MTRRGRNPGHAGGGLLAAAVRPVLPDDVDALSAWFGQASQGRLPARAQCRDAQGAFESVARVARKVEQGVDLGDRHLFRARTLS